MRAPSYLRASTDNVGEAVRTGVGVIDDVLHFGICDVHNTEAVLDKSLLDVGFQIRRLVVIAFILFQSLGEVFGRMSGICKSPRIPEILRITGVELCGDPICQQMLSVE